MGYSWIGSQSVQSVGVFVASGLCILPLLTDPNVFNCSVPWLTGSPVTTRLLSPTLAYSRTLTPLLAYALRLNACTLTPCVPRACVSCVLNHAAPTPPCTFVTTKLTTACISCCGAGTIH
jgi:hypothetical protein